jgi:predicted metal-binding protein
MVRKIVEHVPDDVLQEDLERYRRKAIDLGAMDPKTISTSEVVIDERVRAKCMYPRCDTYGTCANCPPYIWDLDGSRRLVDLFHHAVFFKVEAPFDEDLEALREADLLNYRIVSAIEADAFYDGHYLAVGFGGQSCRSGLCSNKECAALIPGQECRNPTKSRPNMHSMGMDVCKMATRQGWEMYPVGVSTRAGDVPGLTSLGIVFIH